MFDDEAQVGCCSTSLMFQHKFHVSAQVSCGVLPGGQTPSNLPMMPLFPSFLPFLLPRVRVRVLRDTRTITPPLPLWARGTCAFGYLCIHTEFLCRPPLCIGRSRGTIKGVLDKGVPHEGIPHLTSHGIIGLHQPGMYVSVPPVCVSVSSDEWSWHRVAGKIRYGV